MKLHIIIDSQHADTLTPLWAAEELDVDYRGEPERATRCTEAFAATELKRLLAKAVPDLECVFACKPAAEALCIRLETRDPASREDWFDIDVHGHAVVIRGDGRTGTLHGAYELLRHQGWRWIEPGARGEVYVGSAMKAPSRWDVDSISTPNPWSPAAGCVRRHSLGHASRLVRPSRKRRAQPCDRPKDTVLHEQRGMRGLPGRKRDPSA